MGKWRNRVADILVKCNVGRGASWNGDPYQPIEGFRPAPLHPYNYRNLDYEWEFAYPWYLKRIEGSSVMDGGCLAHYHFSRMLCALGFNVYGVDIAPFPQQECDRLHKVQRPVWDTELPDGSIDCVLANSLLEHIGLPCYGQPEHPQASQETMQEFKRVLAPAGVLLMQVPYGGHYRHILGKDGIPFYRVYVDSAITKLLDGFKVLEQVYVIYDDTMWREVSRDVADKVKVGASLPPCVTYIKARKA